MFNLPGYHLSIIYLLYMYVFIHQFVSRSSFLSLPLSPSLSLSRPSALYTTSTITRAHPTGRIHPVVCISSRTSAKVKCSPVSMHPCRAGTSSAKRTTLSSTRAPQTSALHSRVRPKGVCFLFTDWRPTFCDLVTERRHVATKTVWWCSKAFSSLPACFDLKTARDTRTGPGARVDQSAS